MMSENNSNKEPEIEDIKEYHAGNRVHFVVKVAANKMAELQSDEALEKYFKLSTTIQCTNMVLFDAECKLKRYNNICEIMEDFYNIRLLHY